MRPTYYNTAKHRCSHRVKMSRANGYRYWKIRQTPIRTHGDSLADMANLGTRMVTTTMAMNHSQLSSILSRQ